MTGPKPICAGCGVLLPGFGQPFCGECTRLSGFEPDSNCPFCLSSKFTLKGGLHYNEAGGYVGKCSEMFA